MPSIKRVAVVTGSNKDIDYCTVKGLCKTFDGVVYLTGIYAYFFDLENNIFLSALSF